MKGLAALAGGLAGACALTLIHEGLKRISPDAPRMDLLGMSALEKGLKSIDVKVPDRQQLFKWTLAGDVISNAAYYSIAGIGSEKKTWLRGALLGLVAGIGAVLLPKPLHLPQAPSSRTPQTEAMTIALYVAGGLVAAAAIQWLDRKIADQDYVEDEIMWAMDY